jgi:hypothetical protein
MSNKELNQRRRIEQLEHQVAMLADGLMFIMTRIQQQRPSPIVGGAPTTVSMLDGYKAYRDQLESQSTNSTEAKHEAQDTPRTTVPRVTLQ